MTTLTHRLGTVLAVLCGATVASGQGLAPPYSGGTGAPPIGTQLGYPPAPMAAPSAMAPALPTIVPSPTDTLTQVPPVGCSPAAGRSLCDNGCGSSICCGPVGANGPITYELFFRTGPNFVIGGSSELSAAVGFGWTVGGGGRTLFFNPAQDAAWVLDLGASYTYNDGDSNKVIDVFTPAPVDQNTGQPSRPDELHPFNVRSLHRTSFDFAIGRDWFLNGPGMTGAELTSNSRFGIDVGGRWGYSHVDLIPTENPQQYLRKSGVMHGFTLGTHFSREMPLGATTFFYGVRGQWSYTWMDIIPPQDANLSDVSVLITAGLRY